MTQAPTKAVRAYDAKHLIVLEGLEAVRKRPGMYIGSTGTRGLMHCLWELMDNAVDEAMAGSGSCIEVLLHPDGSAEVRDQGAGIPVDKEPTTGLPGVEVAFTPPARRREVRRRLLCRHRWVARVGASVVNALATRVDVEVDRGGATSLISFRRGIPGIFDGPGPDAGFVPASGSTRANACPRDATGTRVRFWPDRQIFTREAGFVVSEVLDRARQTSYLIPGCRWSSRTPPARCPTARRSCTRAASPSSSPTWPRTSPWSRPSGCREPGRSPRRCRCSTNTSTWSPPRSPAR
jgi:DNA gyrase subunit B